ncbi:hypothetical protein, partial [Gemmatimonas sp.]|uniref:hypothetical protein n=1 Tax=Gemmatimonas sp. TaxID=1962908 RepID=UPI0037C013B5
MLPDGERLLADDLLDASAARMPQQGIRSRQHLDIEDPAGGEGLGEYLEQERADPEKLGTTLRVIRWEPQHDR